MTDIVPGAKPRGGRPRGFDRDVAITTAMELFWRHGYEGVSVGDLTTAIGIAPPSLYAAFGSKAALYREVLDRYAAGPGALDVSGLERAGSLDDGVGALLAAAIASVFASGRACMISSGMLACHRDHDALAGDLADRRRTFEAALRDRLERWVAPAEAVSLSRYLLAVMQGLSVHARDGATRADLESIADHAKAALAPFGAPPPPPLNLAGRSEHL